VFERAETTADRSSGGSPAAPVWHRADGAVGRAARRPGVRGQHAIERALRAAAAEVANPMTLGQTRLRSGPCGYPAMPISSPSGLGSSQGLTNLKEAEK
jgi:hypothetical protein